MTAEYTNQVVVGLLMLSLISVLAIGILAAFLALIYRRRHVPANSPLSPKPASPDPVPVRRYRPSVFENNCRWIAIKSHHVSAVQAALELHHPIPCSWGEGLASLSGHKLFVSPPVNGWILVVGQALPDPSEDVDKLYHFLCKVSRSLGQVQFFNVNRAVNQHAWVRAESGHIRRAYAWSNETLWNEGALTPAELDLGVKCYDYTEVPEPASLSGQDACNSEKVLPLASRWSLDPTGIEEGKVRFGLGVTGDLIDYRLH